MLLESIVLMSIMLGLSMLASLLLEPKVQAGSRFGLTGTQHGEAVKCIYCGDATVIIGSHTKSDRCQKCGAWR